MGHVNFQKGKRQKQQEQATTIPGHTWFTGSDHGTTAQKPEDQYESSSSMYLSIVVATLGRAVSALSADGYP